MNNLLVFRKDTKEFLGAFDSEKTFFKAETRNLKDADFDTFDFSDFAIIDIDMNIYDALNGVIEDKKVNYFDSSNKDILEAINEVYEKISHELELNIIKKVA
jgi:hypothetical protein